MKLQPGVEVTPNVRLESHLANGAMGAVWVAEHLTLNTKVAVKFISEERLDPNDPEVLERFVREATAAAQIKSSHVVQTFDQGVMKDGTPYIVMELLEGEELGERLQRERRLSIHEVVKIVNQTAKALQMGHKIGIVHRDIKPDNIFLSMRDDDLLVKVFDFGIAKIRHREIIGGDNSIDVTAQLSDQAQMGLTNDGVMLGTPEYMSPEAVLNASAVDHHADLWGLAVVAYVSITGKLPFEAEDVGELCVQLLEASFVAPSKLRPEVTPEIDAWFARALAKRVDDRFQTAREMAQALAATLPNMSMPGDPLLTSGSWDSRASAPTLPTASDRGLRGDSFSGAAADAGLVQRRWSPSTIGGGVAAVLVALVVAVFIASGDNKESADAVNAGTGVFPVPAPEGAAERSEDASAVPNASAEPSAKAIVSAAPSATTPPVQPVYTGKHVRVPTTVPRATGKPRPKDPGF